jgi:hypothetical protein
VVDEQLAQLAAAGLGNITCCVLGSPAQRDEAWSIGRRHGLNLDMADRHDDLGLYEIPTLKLVQQWARSGGDGCCLYLHTKGVSLPQDENRQQWRRLMMAHVVGRWRQNMEHLKRADMVGVNWIQDADHPHFQGNFWLARQSWLALLPDIEQFQRSRSGMLADKPWRQVCAEMWLGSVFHHEVLSLVCTNADLWHGRGAFAWSLEAADPPQRCGCGKKELPPLKPGQCRLWFSKSTRRLIKTHRHGE